MFLKSAALILSGLPPYLPPPSCPGSLTGLSALHVVPGSTDTMGNRAELRQIGGWRMRAGLRLVRAGWIRHQNHDSQPTDCKMTGHRSVIKRRPSDHCTDEGEKLLDLKLLAADDVTHTYRIRVDKWVV